MRATSILVLVAMLALLRNLAQHPLTPMTLVCWAVALYVTGWSIFAVVDTVIFRTHDTRR
jgi:hypothetical protein